MAWHPFRNIGLKVAALALGTLLWFTVSGHEIERRITVPLAFRNVPAPLELTGEQIETVSVHVRGDDNIVSTLTEGSLRLNVDLAASRSGANILPLRTDQVLAPPGIEVMQVDPGTVTVTLERARTMSVMVQPTLEGLPAAGFEIGQVSVEPARVMVTGPESRLTEPVVAITERVVLQGRSGRLVQDVGVGVSDSQLRIQGPHTVRVTVQIVPASPGSGDRESTGETSTPLSQDR